MGGLDWGSAFAERREDEASDKPTSRARSATWITKTAEGRRERDTSVPGPSVYRTGKPEWEAIMRWSPSLRLIQASCLWLQLGSGIAASTDSACELYAEAVRIGAGKSAKAPLVFGKPFAVPSLRFQFERDGQIVRPIEVDVFYYWNWIEYPYPEHPFGVWTDAADWFKCRVAEDGNLAVPPHTVRPRGWYNGLFNYFPWPKKPLFSHLEITVKVEGCAPKFHIAREDLERYKGVRATLKISCASPIQVTLPE